MTAERKSFVSADVLGWNNIMIDEQSLPYDSIHEVTTLILIPQVSFQRGVMHSEWSIVL